MFVGPEFVPSFYHHFGIPRSIALYITRTDGDETNGRTVTGSQIFDFGPKIGLRTVRITVTAVQFTGQYGGKYLRDGTVWEYGRFVRVIHDSDDIHYQACF